MFDFDVVLTEDQMGLAFDLFEDLDSESMLDEAAALILNRNKTRYLNEIDPEGQPWIPSQAGLKRRAKGGSGTLFATGRMFHSLQVVDTGPNERTIHAADVPYARKHQLGLDGMPVRRFLGVSLEDSALVDSLLAKRLQELLNV